MSRLLRTKVEVGTVKPFDILPDKEFCRVYKLGKEWLDIKNRKTYQYAYYKYEPGLKRISLKQNSRHLR